MDKCARLCSVAPGCPPPPARRWPPPPPAASTEFAAKLQWLTPARAERLAKDATDRAAMIIAAGAAAYSGETASLAAYLRASGQLTAGLALRALLCGQTGLFEATLVELTGLSPRHIAGLISGPRLRCFRRRLRRGWAARLLSSRFPDRAGGAAPPARRGGRPMR